MPGIFDTKFFNAEVFGKYLETVPRYKQNAFLNSGVLNTRNDLRTMLADQTGGNFISIPMIGRIGGDPVNYDGSTNITATGIGTFIQSMIVVGRAKAWTEKDFSYDITGGHDFMADIARQVATYWDDVDQGLILSVLKGIFGVSTNNFNTDHTLDISAETGEAANIGATTLNNALQKAVGANKNLFGMAIMHSQVATNLENLNLLEFVKQVDANGLERSTEMRTWNGRTSAICCTRLRRTGMSRGTRRGSSGSSRWRMHGNKAAAQKDRRLLRSIGLLLLPVEPLHPVRLARHSAAGVGGQRDDAERHQDRLPHTITSPPWPRSGMT